MSARDRRRRRVALIVSLIIHTALLAPLLMVAPALRTAQRPSRASMRLGLVPEADLGFITHQAPPGRPADSQPARTPAPSQQASRPLEPSSGATAPAASASQTPPIGTTASPSGDSRVSAAAGADGNQDAVRRALRAALACAPGNAQNLDEETRAACRKRLIEGAAAMGEAKVDTIPPLKRAYYDAVQKAYQDIRHYPTPDSTLTRLDGAASMYDQKVMTMPGSLPHAGCGMKFGGPKGAKSSGLPPHSLHFNLGPLVCAVTPPQGVLTEESATSNADDVP